MCAICIKHNLIIFQRCHAFTSEPTDNYSYVCAIQIGLLSLHVHFTFWLKGCIDYRHQTDIKI